MDKNNKKIILDLCAGTGSWSKPYKERPDIYDVRLVTLPEDIRLACVPEEKVYGILAAPPCTQLAGSGARWWATKGEKKLLEALAICDACLRFVALSEPVFWALENPVGRLVRYYNKPKMYFHPYQFGDPYTKKTCLWGKFENMKFNQVEPEEKSRIWYMSPGPERSRLRSITPAGFSKAFFESNQ